MMAQLCFGNEVLGGHHRSTLGFPGNSRCNLNRYTIGLCLDTHQGVIKYPKLCTDKPFGMLQYFDQEYLDYLKAEA
jgi:hypothetical protein